MSILVAVLLGILQGLTEFLPISSSGHLILAREVFGLNLANAGVEKTFDVALHVGTFFGIAAFFWADIGHLLKGAGIAVVRRSLTEHPYSRLAMLVLISTVPAALVGLTAEDFIEETLGNPFIVASLLIGFGLLLAWADRMGQQQRSVECLGWKDAAAIGVAQAIALAPGTSRSGVTITAGLFAGLSREAAARYSFLISLPAIAGAALLKGAKLAMEGAPGELVVPMLVGTLAAAVSGFVAISWLLRFLQRHSLMPFVIYRIALGIGIILLFLIR